MAKVFNEGNSLLIHNRLNRLKTDDKFVEDVMKSSSSFSDEVRAEALSIFAAKETFFKARKYHKIFDVKNFFVMLNRVHNNGEEDVELTGEILNDFVSTLKLSCQDYANIANITKKLFRPDENLALFKKYQEDNHKAQAAYLYLLFEYELMDKASAYLDEQDDYEFTQFRALYNLKQSHKNYKLVNLIDIRAICK
jgi:phosphopantetheinyl transferase (holo-ACP synthase)